MVSELIRNSKVAKADDAAVPTYLWIEAICKFGNISLTENDEEKLIGLRNWMLAFWKRNVTFSLIHHIRNKRLSSSDSYVVRTLEKKQVVSYTQGKYVWTKSGRQTYRRWWSVSGSIADTKKNRIAGLDCIQRSAEATWWEWNAGSRPFFWRWNKSLLNKDYTSAMRDGTKVLHDPEKLPSWKRRQRPPNDPSAHVKIKSKLEKFVKRKYLVDQFIESLISFFDVPKAEDVRVVFNGTSSGLNDAVYAPWFPLPTIRSLLRRVEQGTWMGDADIGEMFYNFMLDEDIRKYAGVDVTQYFLDPANSEKVKKIWKAWCRLVMGFGPSPYLSTQSLLHAKPFILGDRKDSRNPFCWEKVVLNLPGMATYNPTKPVVYKAKADGSLAGDVLVYIDDLRGTGLTEVEGWNGIQQVAKRLNFLGIQNAARKFRTILQEPGPWAGSMVYTSEGVHVLISKDKWSKTKKILGEMKAELERGKGMNFKKLRSDRGFLIYVTRSYPSMVPYLKGIHLTLSGYLPGRDKDGWKITGVKRREAEAQAKLNHRRSLELSDANRARRSAADDDSLEEDFDYTKCPVTVEPATRLKDDLYALLKLCESEKPVKRLARVKHICAVAYGFLDASKAGFGSGVEIPIRDESSNFTGNKSLNLRFGHWCTEAQEQSSNFRELKNLVVAVEKAWKEGKLKEVELFIFTDNEVAERCYYKGTSSNRQLFELILRLRKIEMEGDLILHVIHISGVRMIHCGIDGLSRSDYNEGIAAGKSLESYMDLDKSALTRAPDLMTWVKSWWRSEVLGELSLLTPEEWFTFDEEREIGNALWVPAPAAAEAAVEQMATWSHSDADSRAHVFICPRLWTCQWRKQANKWCDVSIEIPIRDLEFWGEHTHFEPLLIFIRFPIYSKKPFRIRHEKLFMDKMARNLYEAKLQEGFKGSDWSNLLRELWEEAGRICGMC